MSLGDYFTPINFSNASIFLLFFIVFCLVGFWIDKKFVRLPASFWPTRWLLGLGLWTFLVYVSHIFLPLTPLTVIIPIIPIVVISTASLKIKKQELYSLLKVHFPDIILILIPLILIAKPIFVKVSLPPYQWDEMAYHWYSPSALGNFDTWNLSPGLYLNLPRFLETAGIGFFTLTKTYATARLLHFLIFLTTCTTIYFVVKEKLNRLAAFTGYLFTLFFSPDMLLQSTTGYVDVAAACFVVMAFLTLLYPKAFIASMAFLSLALASKYSTIPSAISIFTISLVKEWKNVFNRRTITISLMIIITLGGYWYLKNLILFGNPIHPFLFNCQKHSCPDKSAIFGDWTIPLKVENMTQIANQTLTANSSLLPVIGISFIFMLLSRNASTILIYFYTVLVLVLDWVISSRFTAFFLRYFLHWQLLAGVLIPSSITLKPKLLIPLGIIILTASLTNGAHTISTLNFNYNKYLHELAFAKGSLDIYDWTRISFPNMYHVIHWCSAASPRTPLYTYDPEITWGNYEGQFKIFLVNCTEKIGALENYTSTNPLYVASIADCTQNLPPDTGDGKYFSRKQNNDLICRSEKILPHLYKFTGFK